MLSVSNITISHTTDLAASRPIRARCRCEWMTCQLHSVPSSAQDTLARSPWQQPPSAEFSLSAFPQSTAPAGRSAAAGVEPTTCSPSHVPMYNRPVFIATSTQTNKHLYHSKLCLAYEQIHTAMLWLSLSICRFAQKVTVSHVSM